MQSTVVKHELLVGSFVALAVALGAVWATKRTREKGLLDTQKVRFTVDHGSGLQRGSTVVVRGIEVGSIGDVELTKDHKVRVTADIAPRFAPFITADSVATVVEPPLLGSTKVSIEPGSGQPAGRDQKLDAKLESSFVARLDGLEQDVRGALKKLDTFLAKANETVEQVEAIAKQVREGKGLVSRLLNDEQLAEDVKATLTDVRAVVKSVREGDGAVALAINDPDFAKDLKQSVKDVREVTESVAQGKGTLGKLVKESELMDESTSLVKDVRGTLAKLNELNEQAKSSMAKVESLLTTTEKTVDKVSGLVSGAHDITRELAVTVKKINEGQGTIAALLNDDSIYRETRSLLKELRESVEDLREQAPINSFIGVVFSAF
ncbi:MAG: MlaD family protein [Planctomycetota bacterium]